MTLMFQLCSGFRNSSTLQIPIIISIDGSFITCTTCIVYQYFKELASDFHFSKADAKVKTLFLTAKFFGSFFIPKLSAVVRSLAKGNPDSEKLVPFLAVRTAKIKTLSNHFQIFMEVFFRQHRRFVHHVNHCASTLSESGCKSSAFTHTNQI